MGSSRRPSAKIVGPERIDDGNRDGFTQTSLRNPLAKAVQVLGWMVDAKGTDWGVREVARGLGLAPSTVHRVLSDLEAQGLVRVNAASGRYLLGLELMRLAWKATSRFSVREVAMQTVQHLVEAANETAFLGVYDPVRKEMMFVSAIESTHELRYVVPLNRWGPIYRGSSGLAILAFMGESDRKGVLDRARAAETRQGNRFDIDELQRILDLVRRQGYSRTVGERTPGAVGISAPVFGDRSFVGCVGLSIPVMRFSEDDEARLATLVIRAAEQITRDLHGVTPS